jgi:hypothetical protein
MAAVNEVGASLRSQKVAKYFAMARRLERPVVTREGW